MTCAMLAADAAAVSKGPRPHPPALLVFFDAQDAVLGSVRVGSIAP